jgi:hypothetical protein
MSITFRAALAALLLGAAAQVTLAAGKDQSRILPEDLQVAQQSNGSGQTGAGQNGTGQAGSGSDQSGAGGSDNVTPDLSQPDNQGGPSPDDMSLGEIPDITTIELNADIAKRAIDVYTLVKTKYANTDLEQYDNLQDFVDQNARGKEFEADIKAAKFANVNEWNTAITTLGFAYSGITNDPTADINQQIAEIQGDTKIAQDMKDRMIKSLKAMIPSDNNKKVVQELMKDQAYAEKLKQLDTQEE